jgi:hypothetical protein
MELIAGETLAAAAGKRKETTAPSGGIGEDNSVCP